MTILDTKNFSVSGRVETTTQDWYKSIELKHNFGQTIGCNPENEHWIVCVNKVIGSRIFDYNEEYNYMQVRLAEAHKNIKVVDDQVTNEYGPVIAECALNLDNGVQTVAYYPLTPTQFKSLNFHLSFPFVENPCLEEDAPIEENPPVDLDVSYSLVKVTSEKNMERVIAQNLVIDNDSGKSTHPENKLYSFRCELLEAVDTSSETGRPYAQINSITVPTSLDYRTLLENSYIHLEMECRNEKPMEDYQFHSDAARLRADLKRAVVNKPYISWSSKDLENGSYRMKFKIPFFDDHEGDKDIIKLLDIKEQLNKQLEPLEVQFSLYRRFQLRNKSDAYIKLWFDNPRIAATVGMPSQSVEVDRRSKTTMKKFPNLNYLSPTSLYAYANFVDPSYVNGHIKRLLGVFDASNLYSHKTESNSGSHLTLPNYNPINAHVNRDEVKHLHIELETSDGSDFPFRESKSSKTIVSLSFLWN